MQQADIVGFLRTILVILVVYYAFKFIMRLAFPLLMKKFMGKMERKFQEQQGHYQPKTKVGETVIDKKPSSTSKANNDVGEYVDYEDVD